MGSAKRFYYRKDNGFTLVELMVTVVVMAILLTVGVPGLGGFLRDRQLNNTVDQLSTIYNFARQEAVHRQSRVLLCELDRAAGTCRNNGRVWSEGALAFIDQNGDNQYQAAIDTLLRVITFQEAAVVDWGRGNILRINKNGTATNGSFTVKVPGASRKGKVIVSLLGRVRIEFTNITTND